MRCQELTTVTGIELIVHALLAIAVVDVKLNALRVPTIE